MNVLELSSTVLAFVCWILRMWGVYCLQWLIERLVITTFFECKSTLYIVKVVRKDATECPKGDFIFHW